MSWLTHISHIKTLEAGREVSYGGTFKTTEPSVIATIPVGYADGYPRCLSNKGKVIINGQYVTLVGKDGDAELSMEEVSNAAYSFNYELPCRVARRVPRTYYKDGKLVKATNYMY